MIYLIVDGIEIDFNLMHPQNDILSKFEHSSNTLFAIIIKFNWFLNDIFFKFEHPANAQLLIVVRFDPSSNEIISNFTQLTNAPSSN